MRTKILARSSVGVALALGLAACGASEGHVDLPSAPSFGVTRPPRALVGSWQLTTLQESGRPQVEIADPRRFGAEFRADGRLYLKADCNLCNATYTAGDAALSVGPMACTLAACESMPLDTTYAVLVGAATSWSAAGGHLVLRSERGVLHFKP